MIVARYHSIKNVKSAKDSVHDLMYIFTVFRDYVLCFNQKDA